MGVPVDGVEGEDPYFSSCDTEDEEEEEVEKVVVAVEEEEDGKNDEMDLVVQSQPTNSSSEMTTTVDDISTNNTTTTALEPMIDLTACTPTTTGCGISPDPKLVDLQYCEVVSDTSQEESDVIRYEQNETERSNRQPQCQLQSQPDPLLNLINELAKQQPPKMTETQSQPAPLIKPINKLTKQPPPKMTTRSQTRPRTTPIIPTPQPPKPKRKRKLQPRAPLHCDELKLSDGIAKITPPPGWWDKAGIGNDTTGRGPTWQADGAMGSMTIPGPIKQCASGIGGVYEFAMMELNPMTVDQFRVKADAYRKRQVGVEVDEKVGNKAMDDLARKFWRRLGPTMEPSLYGADMEGTLFNGAEACGWNIDRLESCLQLLRADAEEEETDAVVDHFRLPGVTSAYLYFGMWASVFAAHTEDMNLPSINYLHAGAPKYWYAISPDDSDRFESLMESQFSCAASACPQFLRHKSHLLSPSIITKAGISYTTQVQRAGDVIITFPGSYHFGFNTGFNCAESTNFAFPEWIPMGEKAKVCMCHPHSVRIDIQRFKALHDKYEFETSYEGGPSMTYDEWAKLEAKRILTLTRKKIAHDTTELQKQTSAHPTKPTTKKGPRARGQVVEVVKMLRHKKTMDLAIPSKKSSKKGPVKNDWRLALNARKSAFCPRTKVLCNVKSNDLDDVFFSGVISCVVEDHARVHFAGSTRNEDIWIQTNSCKLYLDGGSLESTQEKKVKKKRVTKKSKKV